MENFFVKNLQYLGRFSRFRVFSHIPAERSYPSYSGVAEILFNLSLHLLRLPDPLPLCLLFADLKRGDVRCDDHLSLSHLNVREILESTTRLQEQLVNVPKVQIFFSNDQRRWS